jgi:hypothetical protein
MRGETTRDAALHGSAVHDLRVCFISHILPGRTYTDSLKEETCLWYGAHPRVRPGNGQTRGSVPTDAGILQLEIEFVSSVRKRIGVMTLLR